ncbi:hypothetical protein GCK32_019159 [Trichostrongylus colubriformis]|uniref:Acyltransferase 3 domain-containing protein n=1 Tax=Trichostrongylus colubriformis TaxID=6319 RepID=A0AAN8IFT6_TRICO
MIFLNTNAYCITNKPIVYCGDISYVLYLIHWPLIVATRYYCDTEQLSTSAIILVVVCSLLISMIAHHTVESFFISRGFLPALVCVIGTYLYIIGTIPMYAVEPNLEFKALNNSSSKFL